MQDDNFEKDLEEKDCEAIAQAQDCEVISEAIENAEQSLKASLEESQKTQALYLDKLQRTMAEFENFRNRTIKEKATLYDNGIREVISQLLPVIDNFERSLIDANKEDSFVKGIAMILSQLNNIMDNIGINKIKALGTQFNPKLHAAISHVEDEDYGKNEIINELQTGYIYKDIVIRHSMVTVAN